MKIVKIIGVFAVVVVALVFALKWGNGHTRANKGDDYASEDAIDVKAWRQDLDDEWNMRNREWDMELYIKQYNDIEQQKDCKFITKTSYDNARRALRGTAINSLDLSFTKCLQQSYYSHEKLMALRGSVDTIAKYENISIDDKPTLTHIVELCDFYTKAKKWVDNKNKNHYKISPTYKDLKWTSFKSKQDAILKEAREFRDNPLYNEIKEIEIISVGLNENKIKETTESYRQGFYEQLSKDIIDDFKYKVQTVNKSDDNQISIVLNGSNVVVYKDKLDDYKLQLLGDVWFRFGQENQDKGYLDLGNFKDEYYKALKAKKAKELEEAMKAMENTENN